MKRQGGFTLIELVVVIVILGILAVTAAPRFLNLQDDARNSTLEGLKGAITGASGIVYGKSAIAGTETAATDTDLDLGNGETIKTIYGYPVATLAALQEVVDGLGTDEDFVEKA
ncbi:type II secretion system protein, partial [Vibrio parahaemolyticus]